MAQGADTTGPLAGVPYDGHLTKEDGKGQWWEGLDPQDLYAQNHAPMGLEWDWDNNGKGTCPARPTAPSSTTASSTCWTSTSPTCSTSTTTSCRCTRWTRASACGSPRTTTTPALSARRGRTDAVLNGKGLNDDQQQLHDRRTTSGASRDVIAPTRGRPTPASATGTTTARSTRTTGTKRPIRSSRCWWTSSPRTAT